MSITMASLKIAGQVAHRTCRALWATIPSPILRTPFMFRAGRYIYRRFTRNTSQVQSRNSPFMRNKPLLSVIGTLASGYPRNGDVKVASIGCNTGAELYSVLHAIKRVRSDLYLVARGADICGKVVEAARRGVYRPDVPAAQWNPYTHRRAEVTSADVPMLAEILQPLPDGSLRVRDWLRHDIVWYMADARDAAVLDRLGRQDFVLANDLMESMDDFTAERCLRNLMRLVAPGGYLVVDGIDLDLKSKVFKKSGFRPVLTRQKEIWTSEEPKNGWPWLGGAREPLDPSEPDCAFRYSVIFHLEADSAGIGTWSPPKTAYRANRNQ